MMLSRAVLALCLAALACAAPGTRPAAAYDLEAPPPPAPSVDVRRPQAGAATDRPQRGADEAERGNPLWAIPLASLSATRERPLFSPSRRPPAKAADEEPAPEPEPAPSEADAGEPPALRLLGTIASESESFALFRDTRAQKDLRLRLGEEHDGWVLRAVHARTVTLSHGDATTTLALPRPKQKTGKGTDKGTGGDHGESGAPDESAAPDESDAPGEPDAPVETDTGDTPADETTDTAAQPGPTDEADPAPTEQ